MKKVTDPKPRHPKEVSDYIKNEKKFQKQMIRLNEGCKKQATEIKRLTKEAVIANREIKKQEDEIKRLKRNLRNLFS